MDELIARLGHNDPEIRRQAAFKLRESRNIAVAAHLINSLHDEDLCVVVYAIQALRNLKDASATEPLCSLITAQLPHRLVVSNACRALGEIADKRAIPSLVQLLQSSDAFTRYDAAFALGEIGDASAVPPLQRLVDDDTMPEYEDEDGDYQDTIYSVGQQARRAIESIRSR